MGKLKKLILYIIIGITISPIYSETSSDIILKAQTPQSTSVSLDNVRFNSRNKTSAISSRRNQSRKTATNPTSVHLDLNINISTPDGAQLSFFSPDNQLLSSYLTSNPGPQIVPFDIPLDKLSDSSKTQYYLVITDI